MRHCSSPKSPVYKSMSLSSADDGLKIGIQKSAPVWDLYEALSNIIYNHVKKLVYGRVCSIVDSVLKLPVSYVLLHAGRHVLFFCH